MEVFYVTSNSEQFRSISGRWSCLGYGIQYWGIMRDCSNVKQVRNDNGLEVQYE